MTDSVGSSLTNSINAHLLCLLAHPPAVGQGIFIEDDQAGTRRAFRYATKDQMVINELNVDILPLKGQWSLM